MKRASERGTSSALAFAFAKHCGHMARSCRSMGAGKSAIVYWRSVATAALVRARRHARSEGAHANG